MDWNMILECCTAMSRRELGMNLTLAVMNRKELDMNLALAVMHRMELDMNQTLMREYYSW